MIKDKKKITFEGQDIYVGIDVHKNSWTAAICTEHRCYRPFTLSPPRVEDFEKNFPLGFYLCAYEAGQAAVAQLVKTTNSRPSVPALFQYSWPMGT